MDVTEPSSQDGPTAAHTETFCLYLAKQLVAKRGFVPGVAPEAHEIAAQSDYILSFTDGYSPIIVALIDREAHPDKAFTLSAERVRAIAEACRAFAGRVNGVRMPVFIHLMEVGPATPDQPGRLGAIKRPSFFSKLQFSAWVVDPRQSTIWTTADYRSRGIRRFIESLLGAPREAVVAPAPVALAPHSFPWLTAAMIAILAAIFAAEITFGVGGTDRLEQPTLATLLAFGGLIGQYVIQSGEWYRLFTAPLLHGGFAHIVLNAISLGLAGFVLEPLIGRAWFAAVFVIGALCGALFSLLLNSDVIISVGASGAVMALFACMLVLSGHFPKGATRTGLQMNAVYVLLPSLLPLTTMLKGTKVDYAAHFGGAIGGAAIGFMLLALWPRDEARPRLRTIALAVAIMGVAAFSSAAALAQRNFPIYELGAALAPEPLIPTGNAATPTQLSDLIARYPRDPRLHFLHALALIRAKDSAGAEQALRAGLAEEALWRRALTGGDLPERMHTILALVVLDGGRKDEAKEIARPACAPGTTTQLRALLDQQKLCAE
jgi:rhomboid protease GluP